VKATVSEASQFIATRLRQLREQGSLSQEQAANLVNLSFKYYQRLESGTVQGMRLSTVERIAKAYRIDFMVFFYKRKPRIGKLRVPPPPHRKKKRQMK
jgi:transcriptional regulator with XRE-family HTH domain